MENMGKGPCIGTHCTKMGADSSAENTPKASKYICPSPKVLDFNEKRPHWASIVSAFDGQQQSLWFW